MISWYQVSLGALLLLGIGTLLFGLVEIFAGGMSSSPAEGSRVSKHGCVVMVIGLLLITAAAVIMAV